MSQVADACAIADRAGAAFAAWAAQGPNARRALLDKAADALEARQEKFVKTMMEEVGATAVEGVTSAMKLYREESFGPVVALIRARDEADAIRLANDSEYGLAAAVFTRDTARGLRVARQIRSGICHINGPTVHDEAQMPFGGVGASGYGRFGGKAGIDQFTELRWITMETRPGHYPF
jgi:acyl-CoA reductase-like NAD-dependent aldehyde dehydrogenase